MELKFLDNVCYSENGHDVKRAKKGEIRFVAHSTACALLWGRKVVRYGYDNRR